MRQGLDKDMRILIIEDNVSNMHLLVKVLESNGFELLQAFDGGQGMEVALAELPDLILLDIQIPVMHGYEVMEALRYDEQGKKIPVIAISANVREEDKIKAERAGCIGFLEKPINTRTIVQDIFDIIRRSDNA